jgi:hypothetical protein
MPHATVTRLFPNTRNNSFQKSSYDWTGFYKINEKEVPITFVFWSDNENDFDPTDSCARYDIYFYDEEGVRQEIGVSGSNILEPKPVKLVKVTAIYNKKVRTTILQKIKAFLRRAPFNKEQKIPVILYLPNGELQPDKEYQVYPIDESSGIGPYLVKRRELTSVEPGIPS